MFVTSMIPVKVKKTDNRVTGRNILVSDDAVSDVIVRSMTSLVGYDERPFSQLKPLPRRRWQGRVGESLFFKFICPEFGPPIPRAIISAFTTCSYVSLGLPLPRLPSTLSPWIVLTRFSETRPALPNDQTTVVVVPSILSPNTHHPKISADVIVPKPALSRDPTLVSEHAHLGYLHPVLLTVGCPIRDP